MEEADWANPELKLLGVEMRMARGTPSYEPRHGALYVMFNAGEEQKAKLPEASPGMRWKRVFDTSGGIAAPPRRNSVRISETSVAAFELSPISGKLQTKHSLKTPKTKA